MEGIGCSLKRRLVCVEYPGVVVNEEKMLKTLGGLQNISTVYSEANRRLELRFRPDDVYCKPACGDRHNATALLLKVVVKRKKNKSTETVTNSNVLTSRTSNEPDIDKELEDTGKISSCKCAILGQVNVVYKFSSMCDFQYLPMNLEPSGTLENIYHKIVPQQLPDIAWLKEPAPLFLPPAAFSRFDSSQGYYYRKDKSADKAEQEPHNIIGRTRNRRSGHAIFVTFDVPYVPNKPRDVALKLLKVKFITDDQLESIKKIFEDRPVWSKNALIAVTTFSKEQLKYLLPAAAYYFVTGPWRSMWVRYGYDPRKEPQARIYQSLDFRIRLTGGMRSKVKAKRSCFNYLLPYKSMSSCRPRTSVINKEHIDKGKEDVVNETVGNDDTYRFEPGMIPHSRQMFYQYCDLHVPEIQAMLEKLPDHPDAKCQEKTGWLPSGMDDQCREIINKLISEKLQEESVNENEDADVNDKGDFSISSTSDSDSEDADFQEQYDSQ